MEVNFFTQEAVWKKKILTLDQLKRRGWSFPNGCYFYKVEEESVNHILLHYLS